MIEQSIKRKDLIATPEKEFLIFEAVGPKADKRPISR
jgi:hypothetical protein